MPPTSPDSTVLSEAYIFYPVHLPGPGYIAGPTLFPGRVIAGFHAKIEHYNPDTWARYILTQTRKYPTCTVVSSFLAVNSGTPKERYWFGYLYSGGAAGPSDFVHKDGVQGARAFSIR